MKNKHLSSFVALLEQRLMASRFTGLRTPTRHSSNIFQASWIIDYGNQLRRLVKSTGLPVLLVLSLAIFPLTSAAQNNAKVVIVPLGAESLTEEQKDILEFFSYNESSDSLTIKGTVANPLREVRFQNLNVRGAGQVRQDFTTDGTDLPGNQAWTQMEEENITIGSAPNNRQAVVVHAFATIDSNTAITCPCEFRGRIIQDKGQPSQIISPPAHLEVEGGDGDIDATISHTFAFISTDRTQNYSFEVQVFNQGAPPASGFYKVDEAGITLTTFGLANVGGLLVPNKNLLHADQAPEGK